MKQLLANKSRGSMFIKVYKSISRDRVQRQVCI